jgi:hypothetical protein
MRVDDHKLEEEYNCTLIMASNIVHYSELLHIAVNGACLLANEKPETKSTFTDFRLEIVFEKSLTEEKLLLLRKVKAPLRVLASNWKQNFIMLIPKPATFLYTEPHEPTPIYPLANKEGSIEYGKWK